MRILGVALTVLLLASAVSAADDEATKEAKKLIEAFREAIGSDAPEERLEAVAMLAEIDHPLVVTEIGKRVLPHPDLPVRELGARILGRMKGMTESVGPLLRDHLGKNEKHPEVQVSIIRAIGRCGYKGARKELAAALTHCREKEYEWVTKEVIRTIVKIDDKPMIVSLLALAELRGKSLPPPEAPPAEEVHYKKTKGENEAEAKRVYERKHGTARAKPKGKAEIITIYWKDDLDRAVTKMTGQEFKTARDFRKWLEKNARDFGIKKRDLKKRPKY